MSFNRIGFFLLISSLSCAAPLSVIPINERQYYTPTAPSNVEPKIAFIEIAYIESGGNFLSTDEKTIEAIKKKAAQLGGDAIIIKEKMRETEYGLFSKPTTIKVMRVLVIRYE